MLTLFMYMYNVHLYSILHTAVLVPVGCAVLSVRTENQKEKRETQTPKHDDETVGKENKESKQEKRTVDHYYYLLVFYRILGQYLALLMRYLIKSIR